MAENEIAAALELMQGGLKFEHDRGGWWWRFREQVSALSYSTEYDAVRDFCRWFSSLKSAGTVFVTDLKPGSFDVDKFMMDGIEALVKAAAEEMRARGEYFDPETVAGALAKAWHYAPYTGDPHEDARPVSTDFL